MTQVLRLPSGFATRSLVYLLLTLSLTVSALVTIITAVFPSHAKSISPYDIITTRVASALAK